MNRLFLFVFCLFSFLGCSKQQEAGLESTENITQETQGQTEEIKITTEQQEPQGSVIQEITKMRNHFLTQEEESALKETGSVIPISYLSPSAILYSSTTSAVIINGQILRQGDSIDDKRVIKIEPEAVVLKDTQGEYIVRLKNVAGE